MYVHNKLLYITCQCALVIVMVVAHVCSIALSDALQVVLCYVCKINGDYVLLIFATFSLKVYS